MPTRTGETLLMALIWIFVVPSYAVILINTVVFGVAKPAAVTMVLLLVSNFLNHLWLIAVFPIRFQNLHKVFWGSCAWQRAQSVVWMFPFVFLDFECLEPIKGKIKKFTTNFSWWAYSLRILS